MVSQSAAHIAMKTPNATALETRLPPAALAIGN